MTHRRKRREMIWSICGVKEDEQRLPPPFIQAWDWHCQSRFVSIVEQQIDMVTVCFSPMPCVDLKPIRGRSWGQWKVANGWLQEVRCQLQRI